MVALDSRALVERLRNRSEATTTARFLGLLNDTDAALSVVQQNPPTMRPPKAFVLDANATRVVAGNATTYVVIHTERAQLRWSGGDGVPTPELQPGEVYAARFHTDAEDRYVSFEGAPTAAFVEADATLARSTPEDADFGYTGEDSVRLGASGDSLVVRATTAPERG
ncbi:hypothetical protein [Halosegnis marinus]|uniref:hypothetical protein n=1 Tax=Halosegnis marinus TaxID=3034023 RepID=UPI00360D510D